MTFTPPSGRPASPPPWPPVEESSQPGPGDGGRRSGLIMGVAAVLGALVVLAGLVLLQRDDDGGEAASPAPTTTAPPGTAPPGTAPPSTAPDAPDTVPPSTSPDPAVEPIACPADIPEPICDAAQFVQVETGRAFHRFPEVELLDAEAFEARRLSLMQEEGAEEVEAVGRTLKAIGLLPLDLDVVATMEELQAASIAGFYDPEGDQLVVRGREFSPLTRVVVAHELVHALDDQWFELYRPEYEELDSEAGFGFVAVAEGHARVVENAFRARLSTAEQADAMREEFALLAGSGIDVFSIPPVLLESLTAPYVLGEELVTAILERDGREGLARAFEDPPRTSEQVLHPHAYLAREPAIDVPPPPADGEVVDSELMGEVGLQWWLESVERAEGWGGDRYVTWNSGTGVCTRVDLVMDTDADLAEVREGFAEWAEGDDRRTVEEVEVVGRPGLRITGCAG